MEWSRKMKSFSSFFNLTHVEKSNYISCHGWKDGWKKKKMFYASSENYMYIYVLKKEEKKKVYRNSNRVKHWENERFVIKYSSFGENVQSFSFGMKCWWNKFEIFFSFSSSLHLTQFCLALLRDLSWVVLCMHKTYDI